MVTMVIEGGLRINDRGATLPLSELLYVASETAGSAPWP